MEKVSSSETKFLRMSHMERLRLSSRAEVSVGLWSYVYDSILELIDSRELLLPAGVARPAFMKPSSAPAPTGGSSLDWSCQSFVLPGGWVNLQQGLWTPKCRERMNQHEALKKNASKITDHKQH